MGGTFRITRWGGYGLVRVALGVILLVAAGLKAHQLATDPFVTLAPRPSSLAPLPSSLAPLLHSRPFLIGIVEFELLLGLLLLSGILPRLTWALSLLCFGGFALVSLYKALSGDASCGCFGKLPVNPWYTFGLDAAAVLALLRWRPAKYANGSDRSARGLRRYAPTVATACAFLGLSVAVIGVGGSGRGADASASDARLEVDAMKTFFGVSISADRAGHVDRLVKTGNSQGVELASHPWSDVRQRIATGNTLPVLLTHRTGPPAILVDVFTFEGEKYFLLVAQDMKPFVLPGREFAKTEWIDALWANGNGRRNVVRAGSVELSVDALWRSFGAIKPLAEARTEFSLTNVSAVPVKILGVHTSCGCTTVGDLRFRAIEPGASLTVPVSVKSGSQPLIQQSVILALTTAADNTPRFVRFNLFGWQPESVETIPRGLDFGLVFRDKAAKLSVRLTESAADKYEIRSVEVGELPITCTTERSGSNDGYLAHCRLDPSKLSTGEHRGVVRVVNSSRRRPVVEIPIRLTVASDIQARPGLVEFSDVSASAHSAPITVAIEHRKRKPVKTVVLSVPDGVNAEVRQRESRSEVTFSLGGGQEDTRTGTIRLSARWQGGEEVVELPCYVFARSR